MFSQIFRRLARSAGFACCLLVIVPLGIFLILEALPGWLLPLMNTDAVPYYAVKSNYVPHPRLIFVRRTRPLSFMTGGELHADYSDYAEDEPLWSYTATYNEHDFRTNSKPPPHEVLVIGDSFVEIGERDDRTFSEIVASTTGLSTFSAGLGWYGPYHYLRLAEQYTAALKPKTVIVSIFAGNVDGYLAFWPSYKEADLQQVRRLLEHSLAIDPKYARAWARLGGTHLSAWIINPHDGDHLNFIALDRAHELARKAVQLDPNLPEAQAILAHVLSRRSEHDAAIAAIERAMALNPNFMDWRFAEVLVLAGEPERAITIGNRHMRLDPFYTPLAPGWLGLAYYLLKQHSQSLAPSRECATRAPNIRFGHLCLSAAYAQLGKLDKARAEAAQVLRIDPEWTINKGARLLPFKRPEDAEHFFDGLRRAGLPE